MAICMSMLDKIASKITALILCPSGKQLKNGVKNRWKNEK
jgi:hypothetical protein